MNKRIFLIAFLTACSGVISALSFDGRFPIPHPGIDTSIGFTISYLSYFIQIPGLAFGLALGIYLKFVERISFVKVIELVFYSLVAWFVAQMAGGLVLGTILFVSGILGASIIAVGLRRIVKGLNPIYPIILAGGGAGYLFQLIYAHHFSQLQASVPVGSINYWYLYASFVIWQVIVGVTIAVLINRSRSR